jgi:hypothetical protein
LQLREKAFSLRLLLWCKIFCKEDSMTAQGCCVFKCGTPGILGAEDDAHWPWLGCLVPVSPKAGGFQNGGRDRGKVSPTNEEAANTLLADIFCDSKCHKVA